MIKPIFRLSDYPKGYSKEYAMVCQTIKEAQEFERFLYDNGRHWCTGTNYSTDMKPTTKMELYCQGDGTGIIYYFNSGQWEGFMEMDEDDTNVKLLFHNDFLWELPLESAYEYETPPNIDKLFELVTK